MGFQGHRFFLSWWLLLVALTCLSQGHFFSEKRLPFHSVANMFESIHKNIQKGLPETRVYPFFGKRVPRSSTTSTASASSSISTTTTSPNMDVWLWDIGDISTTTTEIPQEGIGFRQIINFPIRCPEKHDFVGGRCRLRV